jgi:hypothetical protein
MQGGVIKASARQIRLKDAEFLVRESGRQRMLQSAKRNVHAYVVGELVAYTHPDEDRALDLLAGRGARYNPFRYSAFVDCETEQPLSRAELVQLDERGVIYSGACTDARAA